MDGWFHDLRYSARALVKNPGFAVIAVITLALGIGANTATFTVLDAVVLRGLPYADPERLAAVWVDFGEQGQSMPASSSLDFKDYQQMTTLFEGFAAASGSTVNLTGNGDPEQVEIGFITYNFLPLLGVEPILGRGFSEEEDVVDGPAVVVLSDALFRRRYGSDPSIVGETIQVNGSASLVVGVMPPSFELHLPPGSWLDKPALYAPLQDPYLGPRNRTLVSVIARIGAGVDMEEARAEMVAVSARLREEHLVHQQSDMRIRLVPLHDDVVKHVRPALLALFFAVGLLLCIACGTVANLLLARATAREREVAIRASLGAARGRIARQLITESALLALIAGAFGLLLALWGAELLLLLRPTHLPRLGGLAVGSTAFAFTLILSLATVLLFGVLPAIQASRPTLYGALREGGLTPSSHRGESLRRLFVAGEIALSLVLLIGVGVLTRSLLEMREVRPGFDPDAVFTFRVSLPTSRYPSTPERVAFHDELRERFAANPGVSSVGAISHLPFGGGLSQAPYAYDDETAQNWESVTADARIVTTSFFETAGVRLQSGRSFDLRDTSDSPLVTIVDETLAAKAWPGQQAVGRRVMLPVFGPEGVRREWHDVVGVVEHVRLHDFAGPTREQVFFPFRQGTRRSMDVIVRAEGDPTLLQEALRRALRESDEDLPFHNPRTMNAYVSDATAQHRFTVILGTVFGAVALLLAAVALYGLVSYTVSRRAREFGLRIALGARSGSIVTLALRQGVSLIVVGIAVGIPAALVATHAISSLLYSVGPMDPLTFLAVPVLLALVALSACYLPARRATASDPISALRCE